MRKKILQRAFTLLVVLLGISQFGIITSVSQDTPPYKNPDRDGEDSLKDIEILKFSNKIVEI